MLKSKMQQEENTAAPALTPDLLSKLKKEDMKQAVVERFSTRAKAPARRTEVRPGERSPDWQAKDEQC